MRRTVVLASLLLAVLVTACGRSEPIKLGFAGNLTGRASDTGIDARNGTQLAIDEINAQGGVRGRKIELLVRDDEGKAETARKVFTELASAGVIAIVGHVVSGMTQEVLPLANDRKLLLVSPTSVSNVFTGKDDYLIRISPAAGQATANFARFARQRIGVGRAAVTYDLANRGYSEDWFRTFSDAFSAAGGKIVGVQPYTSGPSNDFGAIAKQLLAVRPDSVVIIANAVDTALLCQQLRKIDAEIPVLIAGWAMTGELLSKVGRAGDHTYLPYNFDRDSTVPAYVAFKENYRKRFGQAPDFAAKFSYETVYVLREALEKSPALDGDTLKKTIIGQGRFPGLQGPFRIDRFGDAEARTYFFTIKDGAYQRIE